MDTTGAAYPDRGRRRVVFLAAGLFLLFAALGQGRVTIVDVETRLAVTRQLWTRGTVFLDGEGFQYVETPRGPVSYYGIGQSLLFIPFDMLAYALERAPGLPGPLRRYAGELPFAFLYCPLVGLAWWWTSARLAETLGLSRRHALLGSTLLCTTTAALLHISQTQWEEPIVGAILNLSLIQALRWVRCPGRPGAAAGSGFWLGLGVLFRVNAVLSSLVIVGVLADGCRRRAVNVRRLLAGAVWFVLGLIGPILIYIGYNALRFGDPFADGYAIWAQQGALQGGQGLVVPVRPDVALALLFGAGRGWVTTSPVLLLPLGGLLLMRRHRLMALSLLTLIVISAAVYSKLSFFPEGGVCWGSRYLVHLIGMLVYPAVRAIVFLRRSALGSSLVVGIIAVSRAVQVLSVLAPESLEKQQEPSWKVLLMSVRDGQLARRADNIARTLRGRPLSAIPGHEELVGTLTRSIPNFWGPVYARRLGPRPMGAAVLAAWGATLAAGIALTAAGLRNARRRRAPAGPA